MATYQILSKSTSTDSRTRTSWTLKPLPLTQQGTIKSQHWIHCNQYKRNARNPREGSPQGQKRNGTSQIARFHGQRTSSVTNRHRHEATQLKPGDHSEGLSARLAELQQELKCARCFDTERATNVSKRRRNNTSEPPFRRNHEPFV